MLQLGTKIWPKMRDGFTVLNERYFNPIFELLDRRLHAVELQKDTLDGEIEKFQTLGLDRINQVLSPAFETISRAAEVGFLTALSTTEVALVANNDITLVLREEDAPLFAPTPWILLARIATPADYAVCRFDSYVREGGLLSVTVEEIVGSAGPHDDWVIAGLPGSYLLGKAHYEGAETAKTTAVSSAATAAGAAVAATAAKDTSVAAAGTSTAQAVIATTKAAEAAASALAAATFDPSAYYSKTASDTRYYQKSEVDAQIVAARRVTATSYFMGTA